MPKEGCTYGRFAIRTRRVVLLLSVIAVLFTGVSPASAQTSDWTIIQIEQRRDEALHRFGHIVDDFTAYLTYNPNPWWTEWFLGSAMYEIENEADDARRDIERLMSDRRRSDRVRDAGRAAIEQVELAAEAAVDTLDDRHEAWLRGDEEQPPPPPTTIPPTTTTVPPTTTTTVPPTVPSASPPADTTVPPTVPSASPPADTSNNLEHRPFAITVDVAGDPLYFPEQTGAQGLLLMAAGPPSEVQLPLVAVALRAVGRALPGSIVEPVFGLLVLLEIILRALVSGIKSFWFLALALAFLTGLSLRNLNRKTQFSG